MYKSLAIEIRLQMAYTIDALRQVIMCIKRHPGVLILDYRCDREYFVPPIVMVENAVERILKCCDEESILQCAYEDTTFCVSFSMQDSGIRLFIWDWGYPWKKKFERSDDHVDFDIARYVRLFLNMFKSLPIGHIQAQATWD